MNDIGSLRAGLTPPHLQGQRSAEARRQETVDKSAFYPRRRARENIIPDSEELARLIDRALTALSQGVYWDRGSIVNVLL